MRWCYFCVAGLRVALPGWAVDGCVLHTFSGSLGGFGFPADLDFV